MHYAAFALFVLAVVAGAAGFGEIGVPWSGSARILFFIFMAFLIVGAVTHIARGHVRTNDPDPH